MNRVQKINDYFSDLSNWADEHYIENADNCFAEYILTAGYSEHLNEVKAKILDRIEDKYEITDEDKEILRNLNIKNIVHKYGSASCYNFYSPSEDYLAILMSEIEEQVDDEIVELLDDLTPEELAEVDFKGHYSGGYIYYGFGGYGWELDIDIDGIVQDHLK